MATTFKIDHAISKFAPPGLRAAKARDTEQYHRAIFNRPSLTAVVSIGKSGSQIGAAVTEMRFRTLTKGVAGCCTTGSSISNPWRLA